MDHSADRLPSLAVLPFTNMSGDPEQEYFADGVVEDILTALSRFKSFAVVARNSSFVYKGRAVDVRQVSKDLGVRYVLEGSVRRAGERLRITAQLVDGTNGAHLWADKYDGKVEDIFDVQDRITESVVGVVEPHIREAEIERSRRERPGSVEAYDLYLHALPKFRLGTEPGNRQAWELLNQVLALEPDNPAFLAEASRVVERVLVLGWTPLTGDDRRTCADFARRGLAVAGNDASVLATCAVSLMSAVGDVEVGMATIKRALDINPNQSRVLLSAGIANLHHGSLEEAIYCFQRNLRLSPASPSAYVSLTGVAHAQMALGRYEDAYATAEQSLALSADYAPTYWMLTSAAALLGRMDDARRWLRRLLALEPKATIAQIRAAQPFEERVKAILEGLVLAGLPET
jgi:TolB-like protein/Flp pilus assembly protein TadD